jgi:hypothetical protein
MAVQTTDFCDCEGKREVRAPCVSGITCDHRAWDVIVQVFTQGTVDSRNALFGVDEKSTTLRILHCHSVVMSSHCAPFVYAGTMSN